MILVESWWYIFPGMWFDVISDGPKCPYFILNVSFKKHLIPFIWLFKSVQFIMTIKSIKHKFCLNEESSNKFEWLATKAAKDIIVRVGFFFVLYRRLSSMSSEILIQIYQIIYKVNFIYAAYKWHTPMVALSRDFSACTLYLHHV